MSLLSLSELIKKLKAYQREALLPLYKEHSIYLTRVIKTLVEKDSDFDFKEFINSISAWQKVATCHEVAINNSSSILNIENHLNRLGKEREYRSHPKAKSIGRDLRVKIIWGFLYNNLTNKSFFDNIKPYNKIKLVPHIICTYCSRILFEAKHAHDGWHADGTERWYWEYTFISGIHENHIFNEYNFEDNMEEWEVIRTHNDWDFDDLITVFEQEYPLKYIDDPTYGYAGFDVDRYIIVPESKSIDLNDLYDYVKYLYQRIKEKEEICDNYKCEYCHNEDTGIHNKDCETCF